MCSEDPTRYGVEPNAQPTTTQAWSSDIKAYRYPDRDLPIEIVWYGSGFGPDRDVFDPLIVRTNDPTTATELVRHLIAQASQYDWRRMPVPAAEGQAGEQV